MPRSTLAADYQDIPRPVAVLCDERPPGARQPRHKHERGQLIFSLSGMLLVMTRGASFFLPPQRALWVPPGTEHESIVRGHVSLRTLYVSPAARPDLPMACRVMDVSPLLRELIIEAARLPIEYDLAGRDGRIMELILDEIAASKPCPLSIPMPRHPGLRKICEAILNNPGDDDELGDWAHAAGLGRRTFTRIFRRETNCSFAAWRQNVRLMEALSLLASGRSVTEAAFAVGYTSSSAFTAMFRKAFGAPPTRYLSHARAPEV
jgi:AraC-like DNA-binding protein